MITVSLSPAEIADRSQALARYAAKLIDLSEEEGRIRKDFRGAMRDVRSRRRETIEEIERLSRAVRFGVEDREAQASLFTGTERATPAEAAAIVREFYPNAQRVCRVCGCTNDNCIQCVRKTGRPCHWVEDDLCSACAPAEADLAAPRPLILVPDDGFTAVRCAACSRIDGGHTSDCPNNPDRLSFDDYLGYAKTRYQKNHASHARKMELRRDSDTDEAVRAWKAAQANSVEVPPAAKPARRKSTKPARPAIAR